MATLGKKSSVVFLPETYQKEGVTKYLEKCVDFLDKFSWMFDFQLIHFFVLHIWESMPDQWFQALQKINYTELGYVPFGKIQETWPEDLKDFVLEALTLSLDRTVSGEAAACDLNPALTRGMNAKKLHEVSHLASCVHELCQQHKCGRIVDVGSGLAYLSLILSAQMQYSVLGLECEESRCHGAQVRAVKLASAVPNLRSLPVKLERCDQAAETLERLVRTAFDDAPIKPAECLQRRGPERGDSTTGSGSRTNQSGTCKCTQCVCVENECQGNHASHIRGCVGDDEGRTDGAESQCLCGQQRAEFMNPARQHNADGSKGENCGHKGGRSRPDQDCGHVGGRCRSDQDCGHVGGRCRPDQDCGHVGGRCRPDQDCGHVGGRCRSDQDCGHVGGRCRPDQDCGHVGGRCRPDQDCGHVGGRCRPDQDFGHVGGRCRPDQDCGHADGTCRPHQDRHVTSIPPNLSNVCLLSLHSCGDLTPLMLESFLQVPSLKCLICLGCCYHKMTSSDEGYSHLPMSATLRGILSQKNGGRTRWPGVCGLRLAAQETRTRWLNQSENDHVRHMKSVAYRGLLELACQRGHLEENIRYRVRDVKHDTSFEAYTTEVLQKVPDDLRPAVTAELHRNYDRYEPLFATIEPFTCLQVVLQPVLESLIVVDRAQFLKESGLHVRVTPVADENISPRNLALVAWKE